MQSGGDEAVEGINAGITGLIEKNADKADEIMRIASGIDWTDENALVNFNNQLREIGVNIDKNGAEWESLKEGFSNINIAITPASMETVKSQLRELKDLANDITIGSIISDEDYDALMALKPEL